jgi:hypothetical protein
MLVPLSTMHAHFLKILINLVYVGIVCRYLCIPKNINVLAMIVTTLRLVKVIGIGCLKAQTLFTMLSSLNLLGDSW